MAKQSWTAGRHRSKKNKGKDTPIKRQFDFRLPLSLPLIITFINNLSQYSLKVINFYGRVMECRTKVKVKAKF